MRNNGFLIMEILIAVFVFTLFAGSFAHLFSVYTNKYSSRKKFSQKVLTAQNTFESALSGQAITASEQIQIQIYAPGMKKISFFITKNRKLELLVNE
ncbi:hypothetical protein ACFLZV_06580 [Candidatus Margulisiibacteriota bacterium]